METAIITGASSGLGTEYVKAVLKLYPEIKSVWVIARREERLAKLKEQLGEVIRPIKADLTNGEDLEKIKALLENEKPDVRLLINNAGYGKLGLFSEISSYDNGNMVRLNCEGLTVMTSIVLPYIKDGGEIVNTCSIASFVPNTRLAVYSSTKAYVMSLSRALRKELKPRRINVLAVCPGPMETEFLSVADITPGSSKTFDALPRVNATVMAYKSLKASKKHRAVYTNRFMYKFYRLVAKILPMSIVMNWAEA